ncbi:MAG: hypothetical protein PF692_11810 [Kiritimatiellae bacterium]|jgi:hypothetical protein|nr:hypothetical protein [Kiritimatiellia bacterium]
MIDFLKIFFTAAGGTGAAIAVCIWPITIWLKKKIEADVQSKYDVALKNLEAKNAKELEGFKAGYQKVLDENQIRFSWYYSEKAQVIKELHEWLCKLNISLDLFTQIYMSELSKMKKDGTIDKAELSVKDKERLEQIKIAGVKVEGLLTLNAIFFEPEMLERIQHLSEVVREIAVKRIVVMSEDDIMKVRQSFVEQYKPIIDELRNKFRAILDGTDCEVKNEK